MTFSAETKMRSADRELKLEVMEGKKPLGTIDPKLLDDSEGNRLRAVMDPHSCLWSFKYDVGAVPGGLRGEYTGFKALMKFADGYFASKNILIKEVKD